MTERTAGDGRATAGDADDSAAPEPPPLQQQPPPPQLGPQHRPHSASAALEAVYNVPVQVAAVLGRATMPVSQLLRLGRGAVVKLDRRVGEPIDIYVNHRLVARGEVMVVDDQLTVTMTEIIKGGS